MRLPQAPEFWWRRRSLTGALLAPLGLAYGRIAARRMYAGGVSVGVPVICVGNLVMGGAGKTPTALAVAGHCRELNLKPGFLTRGYRGREKGPLLVLPGVHRAEDVGDEALLLAQSAPTVVAVDRVAGAKLLGNLGVDIVVMDDGFQNPSLNKDLSLVVVDAARGVGNGFPFPAGPLRAPLVAQIRHADVLVILGKGGAEKGIRAAARAGRSMLRAEAEPLRRRGLKRRPYLAFSGIADPAKFVASLTEAGAVVAHRMDFPDHHLFTEADCQAILAEAKKRDLVPITTEKDRVRLNGRGDTAGRLAAATEVFPIRVRFEEPRRLKILIADAAAAHAGSYRREAVIARGAVPVPA